MSTLRLRSIASALLCSILLIASVASESLLLRKGNAVSHSHGARSLLTTAASWGESKEHDGSLRIDISGDKAMHGSSHKIYKKILIRNDSREDATYTITSHFLDEAINYESAAVVVACVFPGKIKVSSGAERSASIVFEIHGDWVSSGVSIPSDYNGHLEIDHGREEPIKLSWHFVTQKTDFSRFKKGISDEVTDVK